MRVGHVHGGGFVTNVDDRNAELRDDVPDGLDVTALQTEDARDAARRKEARDQLRRREQFSLGDHRDDGGRAAAPRGAAGLRHHALDPVDQILRRGFGIEDGPHAGRLQLRQVGFLNHPAAHDRDVVDFALRQQAA